jgi:F-box and leucine-rich repeat protein 2/20
VFWRLLRPEFIRHFRLPLSPNAFNVLALTSPDRNVQLENIKLATQSLIQDLIPSFLNDLSGRDFVLPLSQGLGLDISSEFHCRGINIRHIGYMRSALFRKLPGFCKLFFDEDFVRTTRDLRDEVTLGDNIIMAGVTYEVIDTINRPITYGRFPISTKYLGEPIERLKGIAGAAFMKTDKNGDILRALFLAEMVARAIKGIVRLLLRTYVRKAKGTSPEFLSTIYCEYFNVVTGAHPRANFILQEDIFERIRETYGARAVRASERDNIQLDLQPCIVYIIKRLQTMLGVQLSFACVGEFNERPVGFAFCPVDFLECTPVVRHNMPFMIFAEAKLVTLKAEEAEANTYENLVLKDRPALYFRLQDRKGTRELDNKGSVLSSELAGKASPGCILERAGPISFDPLSRSFLFDPESKPRIDGKFHPSVVPISTMIDHFTVELYAKVTGGSGTRCAIMSGRYCIQCNRENEWVFVFIEGIHEVYLKIAPVVLNEWVHLVGTFDGTTLRCYKNSIQQSSIEVELSVRSLKDERMEDFAQRKTDLNGEECAERELQKTESIKEAEKYFKTREGASAMKSAMKTIMESYEFQSKNIGMEEKDASSASRVRKTEALKQARQEYITELYIKNVHEIAARFTNLRDEVDEAMQRDASDAETRSHRGVRIGASCASSMPSQFFCGYLAHVAVYPTCLSAGGVVAHHMAGSADRTKDAQRLHAVASARYEDALAIVADDPIVMRSFALSLCRLLKIEMSATTSMGVSRGKIKVLEAIYMFKKLLLPEGIGEILMALPRDTAYAHLVCEGLGTIFEMDSLFFSRNKSMTRADLVNIPDEYALCSPENPKVYIHIAAKVYQEVSRDARLVRNYGDVDLSFLSYIKTSELVVSLIQCIKNDSALNVVNVGEMFKAAKLKEINITDDDVQVLAENLPLSIGFNLSYAPLITNACTEHISRLAEVRVLVFEGCVGLTDGCIDCIADACSMSLEVLSLAGNRNITDNCFTKIVQRCRSLTLFNVSGCPNITHLMVSEILKANKRINTLFLSATYITDEGLALMATVLSSKFLTSLDLSFCRDISDRGIISIAEKCTNLTSLNLCGLNRVTDEATRSVCANCWYLKSLSLEDVFLLDDSAFWFDRNRDGRPIANENMLTSLTSLNLRDCVNITDRAMEGLSERCRQLETVTLRGCEKLTSGTVSFFRNPCQFKVGMCDSIKSLDLSYCASIAPSSILDLLVECACLEELFLEGLIGINDDFVHQMCVACRTITKLSLQRCQAITDASLCSIADFLWIELLDISHCTKISDLAVETLTLVCNAIQELRLRRCNKLTSHALFAIVRNCADLRELDIRDCPLIPETVCTDLRKFNCTLRIIT